MKARTCGGAIFSIPSRVTFAMKGVKTFRNHGSMATACSHVGELAMEARSPRRACAPSHAHQLNVIYEHPIRPVRVDFPTRLLFSGHSIIQRPVIRVNEKELIVDGLIRSQMVLIRHLLPDHGIGSHCGHNQPDPENQSGSSHLACRPCGYLRPLVVIRLFMFSDQRSDRVPILP